MKFLRDTQSNVQGFTRDLGNGVERLFDSAGNPVATYRSANDSTYDKHANRIGNGNRLAGMVGKRGKITPKPVRDRSRR